MKVLIAIDNSEYGEYAVQDYVQCRHKPGDDVIIVQLTKPDGLLEQSGSHITKAHSVTFQTCGLSPTVLQLLGNHNVSYRLCEIDGKAGEAVCDVVAREDVTMIILGERTPGRLERLLVRPSYDHILKHVKVPVIVYSNKHTHAAKKSFYSGNVTWIIRDAS